MAVKFNELLEGAGLSEEARVMIQEAWESRLAEAKEELTAELREEFAQRYDHDRGLIVEAVDKFVSEQVAVEMSEFVEDKKALAAERVKYRRAISEHAKLLDRFVTEMVSKEVRELRSDRSRVAEHVGKLDEFVAEQLAQELKEFHQDKRALVEQKVKMVREGKRQLAEAKKDFIKRAVSAVEKTVNTVIAEEVKQFRSDITSARENDFGRRIFEAFALEYNTSYLNEAKEIKRYQKAMAEMSQQLKEAKQEVDKAHVAVQQTQSKLRISEDRYVRKNKLDELLRPLGKEKKEVMMDLLESVATERLDETFKKYLPTVLEEQAPRVKKQSLSESTKQEHTGDKAPVQTVAHESADVVELDAIRKLAGLSK